MSNQHQQVTAALVPVLDPTVEAARIGAVARLGHAAERFPQLRRASATARLDLAAAIIAMDQAEDMPGRHNMNEQAAVETALRAYGHALADFLRGEATEPEGASHHG